MTPNELIHRYLAGVATAEEVAELDGLLANDSELRKKFVHEAGTDAGLREIALERKAEPSLTDAKIISPVFRPVAWVAAAASIILLAALTWTQASRPKVIAELVTAENAAWESSLPTELGSKLTRGTMRLTSGIASIRFHSGAEMVIEAPAKLFLKGPMRARLSSGAAVVTVPETAIGFVLETPDGHAVDHGTSFAVNVSSEGNQTDFEVIEGEISVHVSNLDEGTRLTEQQSASITGQTLSTFEGPLPEKEVAQGANLLRLGTAGRSCSVIRANKKKWLHPDKLTVKRKSTPSNHERRAFFAFDLSQVDLDAVQSVQLRLNQVPSGIGYASRLPIISRIAIFGLTNPAKADWQMETTWEEAPAAEDGILLGHLEIPRSQQQGTRLFSSEALHDFVKENQGNSVTFTLDREIDPLTGEGVPSLVHAFASDTNPEAPGPMLEFTLKN